MLKTFRKWHRWISLLVALPFFVTLTTGLLLATRGFNTWVQPSYPPLHTTLKISFDQILHAAQSAPEAGIKSWDDISQIDIRPATGNIRVRAKTSQIEIQIDGETGKITGQGLRRVTWLMTLHEGAYFGSLIRYGLFLPSALGVLFLLISGLWIFFQPYIVQFRNRTKGSTHEV